MPAVSAGIAVAGLAVSAIGASRAHKAQKQQAQYAQQAADFQQKQVNLQNARAKRDAVRTARISFANAQNAAANQGVSGSSSAMGGQASIGSQLKDNVSFLDQYGFYSDQASKALGKSNAAGVKADTANSIAGLGMSVFNNATGIANVFGAK